MLSCSSQASAALGITQSVHLLQLLQLRERNIKVLNTDSMQMGVSPMWRHRIQTWTRTDASTDASTDAREITVHVHGLRIHVAMRNVPLYAV